MFFSQTPNCCEIGILNSEVNKYTSQTRAKFALIRGNHFTISFYAFQTQVHFFSKQILFVKNHSLHKTEIIKAAFNWPVFASLPHSSLDFPKRISKVLPRPWIIYKKICFLIFSRPDFRTGSPAREPPRSWPGIIHSPRRSSRCGMERERSGA